MKKKILVFCMFLFTATFLFAGNGILRVSANMTDMDIYNGDEQIAMLGQDYTDIELPKGKYTIVLKKPIDEEKEYFASKSVFVGSDTVLRVKFELEKRFTPKGLEQEKIREEKNRIEKELEEEKRRIEKQKKEEQKKNSFKSQDLEKIGLEIKYTVENNIVNLIVSSSSLEESGKGGISISFPQFLNDSRILEKKFTGFDEVNNYPEGSKLWNNDLKKSIKSSYLLIEGWHNSWNKKEIKEINLTINAENLDNLEVHIRTNILKNKNEFLNPSYGYKNEQGYYDKIINIGIKNKIYNHINTSLSKWDEAHNLKNEEIFNDIYSDNLKYYNMDSVSKKYVIEDKIKKLKENADFKQSSTVFDIVKLKDNIYKVFFDKYNYFNKKSKKFNSYLVIKDIGNNKFEIIEEGDISQTEIVRKILAEKDILKRNQWEIDNSNAVYNEFKNGELGKEIDRKYAELGTPTVYNLCAGCHGVKGEEKAFGQSKIINKMTLIDIENALNGYKKGIYGGAMKSLMENQVNALSEEDIKNIAKYLTRVK